LRYITTIFAGGLNTKNNLIFCILKIKRLYAGTINIYEIINILINQQKQEYNIVVFQRPNVLHLEYYTIM